MTSPDEPIGDRSNIALKDKQKVQFEGETQTLKSKLTKYFGKTTLENINDGKNKYITIR